MDFLKGEKKSPPYTKCLVHAQVPTCKCQITNHRVNYMIYLYVCFYDNPWRKKMFSKKINLEFLIN